jgi:negative regulator of sigma E activity
VEKNPAERYGTAQELADDLERFLKDEPIRARRPTWWQRSRKWARRHRPVVLTAAVALALVLVVTVISLAVGYTYISQEKDRKAAALRTAEANLQLVVSYTGF